MNLPRPVPRQLLHLRDIQLRGYLREDGLLEIEAHLTDAKTYSLPNIDRGGIQAGEPVHDMWMRMAMTPEGLEIREVAAEMAATPYAICPLIAVNMQRLVGLSIGRGFLRKALTLLGGVEGCTHLRELLQPIATTAIQSRVGLGRFGVGGLAGGAVADSMVNSCHAFAEDGPVVARGREQAVADGASAPN